MERIVLDTNVLVSGAHDELAAGSLLLEACLQGELRAIVSPDLRREYERILEREVRIRGFADRIRRFLETAEIVYPRHTPRLVPDDPEDDKVLGAAIEGRADAIVTCDRHLLDLDLQNGIRIVRPETFEQLRRAEGRDAWRNLAKMIGIE